VFQVEAFYYLSQNILRTLLVIFLINDPLNLPSPNSNLFHIFIFPIPIRFRIPFRIPISIPSKCTSLAFCFFVTLFFLPHHLFFVGIKRQSGFGDDVEIDFCEALMGRWQAENIECLGKNGEGDGVEFMR
jgi:hypothetical protein